MTYARLVGRENVLAGTDCGFSQGALTPRVHASIMWAKLQALAEGAALATTHSGPLPAGDQPAVSGHTHHDIASPW